MERQRYEYDEMWKYVYGSIEEIGPTHLHIRRLCRRLLMSLDFESVLDVGCGPGHNIPLLCEGRSVKRLAGVDISKEILDVAMQRYKNWSFHYLDIEKGHLDDQYDLVFCSLVLEHLIDDAAALRNLHAMTGKYLLLVTIQGNYERYARNEKLLGHLRNYRQGELVTRIKQENFRIIEKIEWGFPFYSPIGRLLCNLSPKRSIGKSSFVIRFIANVLYLLCFLNSSRKGDIIIVLVEV